jgi:hypothetical protein
VEGAERNRTRRRSLLSPCALIQKPPSLVFFRDAASKITTPFEGPYARHEIGDVEGKDHRQELKGGGDVWGPVH